MAAASLRPLINGVRLDRSVPQTLFFLPTESDEKVIERVSFFVAVLQYLMQFNCL